MRWTVTAESLDRKTGRRTGGPREETVDDTSPGTIFLGCRTEEDVKTTYEDFWRDGADCVRVVSVRKI